MKKKVAVLILSLMLLIACSPKENEITSQKNKENESSEVKDKEKEQVVVENETLKINDKQLSYIIDFVDFNANSSDYLFTSIKIKPYGNSFIYEVDFVKDNNEYELEFNDDKDLLKEKIEPLDAEDQIELEYEGFKADDLKSIKPLEEFVQSASNEGVLQIESLEIVKRYDIFVLEIEDHNLELIFNAETLELIEKDYD